MLPTMMPMRSGGMPARSSPRIASRARASRSNTPMIVWAPVTVRVSATFAMLPANRRNGAAAAALGAGGDGTVADGIELAAERALVRQRRAAGRAGADVRGAAVGRQAALGDGARVDPWIEVPSNGVGIDGGIARAPKRVGRGVARATDDDDRYGLAQGARDRVRERRGELPPLAVLADERAQRAQPDIPPLVVLGEPREREQRVRGERVLLERPLAARESARFRPRRRVEEAAALGVLQRRPHAPRLRGRGVHVAGRDEQAQVRDGVLEQIGEART